MITGMPDLLETDVEAGLLDDDALSFGVQLDHPLEIEKRELVDMFSSIRLPPLLFFHLFLDPEKRLVNDLLFQLAGLYEIYDCLDEFFLVRGPDLEAKLKTFLQSWLAIVDDVLGGECRCENTGKRQEK